MCCAGQRDWNGRLQTVLWAETNRVQLGLGLVAGFYCLHKCCRLFLWHTQNYQIMKILYHSVVALLFGRQARQSTKKLSLGECKKSLQLSLLSNPPLPASMKSIKCRCRPLPRFTQISPLAFSLAGERFSLSLQRPIITLFFTVSLGWLW